MQTTEEPENDSVAEDNPEDNSERKSTRRSASLPSDGAREITPQRRDRRQRQSQPQRHPQPQPHRQRDEHNLRLVTHQNRDAMNTHDLLLQG